MASCIACRQPLHAVAARSAGTLFCVVNALASRTWLQDTRIARGDGGSVFVLVKEPGSASTAGDGYSNAAAAANGNGNGNGGAWKVVSTSDCRSSICGFYEKSSSRRLQLACAQCSRQERHDHSQSS